MAHTPFFNSFAPRKCIWGYDLAKFSNSQRKERGLAREARAKPLSLRETCQVVWRNVPGQIIHLRLEFEE